MSAMVYNRDHFVNAVYHGGGSYALDMETFDASYVIPVGEYRIGVAAKTGG